MSELYLVDDFRSNLEMYLEDNNEIDLEDYLEAVVVELVDTGRIEGFEDRMEELQVSSTILYRVRASQ